MKKYIILTIALVALALTSCEKFLQEDIYSATSIETQILTEDGYETLINACYVTTKVFYGKEYGWDMTTVGTDLWTYAGDADDMMNLASYTSMYNNQWPARIGVVWAELYKGLNTCNAAIAYMPEAPFTDEKKIQREGEVRFLRALYLWNIVEQWGNVFFSNKPITEPEYEMHRTEVDVFYTQILNDLDTAILYLPDAVSSSDYGRAHKYAAYALRARANLYWAAEYMSGNNFENVSYAALGGRDHLQQAISDAQMVIDSDYELYTDFAEVWDMDLNSSKADENTENIWAINYSQSIYAEMNIDPAEYDALLSGSDPKPFNDREGGNQGHMMFGMRWFAIGGGNTFLKDDGVGLTETEPTRPFCRYMPTRYLIELYDNSVDQRFNGSFNYVFFANNPTTTGYYKWQDTMDLADGTKWVVPSELVGQNYFDYMDSAFVMFKDNEVPDSKKVVTGTASLPWFVHKDHGYFFLNLSDMYEADGSIIMENTNQRRSYFDLSKWYDYTRPHNGQDQTVVGSQRGQRDFVVFRLSEMYYIQAEANLLNGSSGEAYNNLLEVANARAIDGNGAAMLSAYGVNGGSDVDIDFILDDRAREFAGEQQRWYDLKRTGKWMERIQDHNPDASPNIQAKHVLRPIPQAELDAIRNKEDFTTGPGIY